MAYYKGLRDLLEVLESHGKLVRIARPIIKETELIPLVRLQFRGLPESKRKAFLFENVTSVTGKKYSGSVAVGTFAASREIYALGMMCDAADIGERWVKALTHPVQTKTVAAGCCQEEVHIGEDLLAEGLDELPVPVNTPGFTGALRTTASHVVTRDIETGVQNCGCYAGKFLDRNLIGLSIGPTHHGSIHWRKSKEKGICPPAAIVIGAPPNIAYTSVAALPYGMDELAVAGGIANEPVEMVKCKTIDLEVPAHSEIVIEGEVSIDRRVGSASFGEFTGFMCKGAPNTNYLMKVTAVTHRRNPIYSVFLSQMPPSESSKIVQIALENVFYKHLRHDCNIPGVMEIAFPESGGGRMICIIRMKKRNPSDVWQALSAANGFASDRAKIIIVVDEDIDPKDPDAVNWALSFRMQPHRDIHIMRGRTAGLDYSAYDPAGPREARIFPEGLGASSLMIDATLKWAYPPISLPKREYMTRAIELWNELELGPLELKAPWYGYDLGCWSQEDEINAQLITSGNYKEVGKKLMRP
jgi:4-hydroxy-3-polyprenylbenzoate decarboxylase